MSESGRTDVRLDVLVARPVLRMVKDVRSVAHPSISGGCKTDVADNDNG